MFAENLAAPGERRIELLGRYQELGVSRVIGLLQTSSESDEPLEALIEDARQAGLDV